MAYKDGIYEGISNEDYHADKEYMNSSALKLFPNNVDEYLARYHSTMVKKESEAMMLGTATHALLLEPDTFFDKYVILIEGINKRTNEGKKILADFIRESAAENRKILTSEQMENIKEIKLAVTNHPLAWSLLMDAKFEQSFFLEHDGLKQKVRADAMIDNLIIDFKTIDKISNFPSSLVKYGYHFSAIMYLEIIGASLNKAMDFNFIVVEKSYPYTCIVRELSNDLRYAAERQYAEAKIEYKKIQDTGVWNLLKPVYAPWNYDVSDNKIESGAHSMNWLQNRTNP